MTGAELVGQMRFLLGDTERRSSTAARRYGDASLLQSLNNAQLEALKLLIARAREERKRPSVTISRLLAEAPATSGGSSVEVPIDFFQLECGYTAAGMYTPPSTLPIGRQRQQMSFEQIYVGNGFFQGTADTAVYWKLPKVIENSDVTLTEFPDAFYQTIKCAAVRDVLVQDGKGVAKRYLFFHQRYLQRAMTLR